MKNWIAVFALTSMLALTACNDKDAIEQGGIAVAGVFNEQLDPRIATVEPLANRGKSEVFLLKVVR